MRTLHLGLRVADPDRAVAFYTAVGYEVVGRVPETTSGALTMLKLPDDDVVSVELVFDPTEAGRKWGTGLSHFVIQVESMHATILDLRAQGTGHRGCRAGVTRWLSGLPDHLDHGPRRQPDRAGPVAARACGRAHRG